MGTPGSPQVIGTRVTLITPDGRRTQVVGANEGAYLCQGHYRLYYGLGGRANADEIRILWPDGTLQILQDVRADRLMTVRKEP